MTNPDSTSGGSGTILVVDDEEMILSITSRILDHAGYRVLIASDGEEATEIFKRHANEVTLVILDLSMPGMTGTEVFRELRKINPEAVIALSTGLADEEEKPDLEGIEPSGFINKPYEMTTLLASIDSILAGD